METLDLVVRKVSAERRAQRASLARMGRLVSAVLRVRREIAATEASLDRAALSTELCLGQIEYFIRATLLLTLVRAGKPLVILPESLVVLMTGARLRRLGSRERRSIYVAHTIRRKLIARLMSSLSTTDGLSLAEMILG
jgi:hypothetical protein